MKNRERLIMRGKQNYKRRVRNRIRNTKRSQSCVLLMVPKYVPIEVRVNMVNLIEPILKPFKLDVKVVETVKRIGGEGKCPVCGKKFIDISGYRAYTRLNQHIHDRHPELVKATIQTLPTNGDRGIG